MENRDTQQEETEGADRESTLESVYAFCTLSLDALHIVFLYRGIFNT